MSLSSFIDDLPIESWAAVVARMARKTRRRVARRPVRTAMGALVAVGGVFIVSNALWEQESRHPAPIWGSDTNSAMLVGTHAPDGAATASADPGEAEPDPLVRRVQESLAGAGYFNGEVDGILSETTAAAIEEFEVERGLPVTGRPSLGLVASIALDRSATADEAPAAPTAEMTVASASPAPAAPAPSAVSSVHDIQAALNRVGYGPLTVDGVMGPRTQDALARFASTRGLSGQGMTPAVLAELSAAASR